jgi:signal transduction histidine kinase/ligand-binding sensor domain-containing protein
VFKLDLIQPFDRPGFCFGAVKFVASLSKKLLVCFCLCFGAITAKAQYRIDQWTADNGLPQNSVYGIVQTGDGYLWLATVDGLARFDGVRFSVFNKSNSPGIVNNRFTALFEDAKGDLWAGTEESVVVRYHKGRFENFPADEGARISWIDGTPDGNGLIFLSGSKVSHFADGLSSPLAPHAYSFDAPSVTQRKNVRLYCESDSCYANGQRLRFSPAEDLPEYKLRSAARGADGNFWFVTDRRELVRVENGKVVRVFNAASGLSKYPMEFITGAKISLVSWDGKDSLWLTDLETMRSDLLLRARAGAQIQTGDIYPPFLEGESVFQSSYQDAEGNLWFGTLRAGLYRTRKQIVTAFSTAEGLADNNVYPIFESDDGSLLVGTTSGVFNLSNERFTPVDSPSEIISAFGKDPAERIVFSSNGNLFVRDGDRSLPYLRGKVPAQRTIHAIHTDLENALWLGAEDGLMRYEDDVLTKFATENGLAGNDVKVIIEAHGGGIWIGTYGGLSLYKDGTFKSWTENDGLPSRTIRALHQDSDGALWIGSYDGGMARFKDGTFTAYNTRIGLYNDGAFQILEDERRNFWVSSNHGIYRVSKDELNEYADGRRTSITSTAYGRSDGMLNAEANGGSSPGGVRTRDGRLWFPTQDGVAMIDPQEIKINTRPPPVVIENVKIDNNDVGFGSSDMGLRNRDDSQITSPTSEIQVDPSQQNFEISYTALSFINSEHLRFKYKLEGLDDDWIDAGTRRLAHFTHVPPGDYIFRVIAANSDNVWNEHGATLRIVVLPPFYRTWWFLITVFIGLAATAFLLFQRRVSQINLKHAAELAFSRRLIDSQEQERKRFAAEMHDGLGQSLVIIKNRARLSLKQSDQKEAMLDHLESISETASHAIHEAKEIAFNLRPHLLDRLGLTKTIESMLDKVFNAGEIEFEPEIDQIDNVLEKNSEILLYRIVQECASNIVKHSGAQKAVLKIELVDHKLTVNMSDNGCGFDLSAAEKDLSKRSFGLVGIAERTRLLGGKISIESRPRKGTKISIIIDLPDNTK